MKYCVEAPNDQTGKIRHNEVSDDRHVGDDFTRESHNKNNLVTTAITNYIDGRFQDGYLSSIQY